MYHYISASQTQESKIESENLNENQKHFKQQ